MQQIDLLALYFVNQFARTSWALDNIVKALSMNHLLKGGMMVTLLWWAWFSPSRNRDNHRYLIIATIVSCVIAEALARILSVSLPFRARPIYDINLPLTRPFSFDPEVMKLMAESSFPSDHAVLFFSFTASLWLISRAAGITALIYTTVMIALPRIFLGLHYPSDIIGGAAIGVLVTLTCTRFISRMSWPQRLVEWSESKPEFFYPAFFLLTYQIADMFQDCRAVISGALKLFREFS